jgi:hypothetical protein
MPVNPQKIENRAGNLQSPDMRWQLMQGRNPLHPKRPLNACGVRARL